MEAWIAKAEKGITNNPEAIIIVEGELFKGTIVKIAGKPIGIKDNIAAVYLVGKAKKGNFVLSLEELEAIDEVAMFPVSKTA
jgi:hypothetical protein